MSRGDFRKHEKKKPKKDWLKKRAEKITQANVFPLNRVEIIPKGKYK